MVCFALFWVVFGGWCVALLSFGLVYVCFGLACFCALFCFALVLGACCSVCALFCSCFGL